MYKSQPCLKRTSSLMPGFTAFAGKTVTRNGTLGIDFKKQKSWMDPSGK